MTETFKLFRLQQIDTQLDHYHARLQEIESAIADRSAVLAAQEKKTASEDGLRLARRELRLAEEQVQAQRIKIEQTEASLYGGKIRNPKELQDLQNESAALKRYLAVLEDKQLEAMLSTEEAELLDAQDGEVLETHRQQEAERNAAYQREIAEISQEVHRLETERQAAASTIPSEDMALYQQLRTQRRGVAVSRVKDRTCSACGSTLSAALLHAVRSPNQVTRCERCSRILYSG